jgi:hypothetical protein
MLGGGCVGGTADCAVTGKAMRDAVSVGTTRTATARKNDCMDLLHWDLALLRCHLFVPLTLPSCPTGIYRHWSPRRIVSPIAATFDTREAWNSPCLVSALAMHARPKDVDKASAELETATDRYKKAKDDLDRAERKAREAREKLGQQARRDSTAQQAASRKQP